VTPSIDCALYLVTDRQLAAGRPLEGVVAAAVTGGCTVVQLREKEASTREMLALACRLRAVLAARGVPLLVNDRVDVALACGAAGVHLGQDDMPCREARRILGEEAVIGVSVSTVEEARRAEADGASYLGVGPVFATPTKTDAPPATGLAGLCAIRAATRLPIVAIGGIKATNAAQIVASGADGIAVVSAIVAAADPGAASRELDGIVRAALARRGR
jgi:thiamine-phosphate pyrophosphorylase